MTMMISAHRISDSTPSTVSRVTTPVRRCRMHGFAKGVERAGADIAIDDADAAKRQRTKALGAAWPDWMPATAARRTVGRHRSSGPESSVTERARPYITASTHAIWR